jgi:hypothetical protein
MIQKNSKSYKFLWHFRFFQHYFWGCRIFELWHCHLVNVSQCFDGTWCLWNTRNQSQTDTMSYLWTPESSYRFCCMKVTLYFKTVTIYVIWFSIHYMYFMYILYFLCFSSKVNVWSYLWVCHEKLWKSGGVAPLFCNLSLTWKLEGEWSVSCLRYFASMERAPETYWMGCTVPSELIWMLWRSFVPTVNQTMIQSVAQSQYRVTYFISPFHLSIMTNCIVCQWIVCLFSILSVPLRMFVLKSVKNLLYVVS